MMFEIWSEGFSATGQSGSAIRHGQGCVKAKSFKAACAKFFGANRYFNREKMTYWGCRLFDNEKEARKSFG